MDITEVKPVEVCKIELGEFEDGDFKGFKFALPQFEKAEDIINAYGEDTLVNMFNTQVATRVRARVKNSLPKDVTPQQLEAEKNKLRTLYPDGIIFTEKDARCWRPDVERIGPNKLFKLAKEAFQKGDMEKGKQLLEKAQELLMKG